MIGKAIAMFDIKFNIGLIAESRVIHGESVIKNVTEETNEWDRLRRIEERKRRGKKRKQ